MGQIDTVWWATILSAIFGFISIVISIVGFWVTNSNITKIKQKQKIWDNSNGYQVGWNTGNINN